MNTENTFSRAGYLDENYHYFHLCDTAGQERDFHFHEFDKLVLLLSGKVDYVVENMTYHLRPWDILLIKHHTIHKALIDQTESYDRVILYLDRRYFDRVMPEAGLLACFDHADQQASHLLTPDPQQCGDILTLLERYEGSMGDGAFGAQALRDTLVMQLLIQVSRISDHHGDPQPVPGDPKIDAALSYINENLSRKLTVDALAEQVYLSKYHFMRLFKLQTGSTVHSYIRQKRLLCAARLIREGTPVGKAAADSGFADYSTFHRAFRESFGISPRDLKQ